MRSHLSLGVSLFWFGALSTLVAAGCKEPLPIEGEARVDRGVSNIKPPDPEELVAKMQARVDQFAVAKLTADVSSLSNGERETLDKLIEAAKLLDPVFDRQAWAGNPALDKELAASQEPDAALKHQYFRIMRGPWDRQNDYHPFATSLLHPKGGGFYPEDMSKEEFTKWVEDHPDDKAAFESLVTMITREGDKLVATPYSKAFAEWLEPTAKLLRNASDMTENDSLRAFLRARSDALLSDQYYESDKLWMDLNSAVEATIGPYETYEDELLGLKAAFEAFITVTDPKASEALGKWKRYLPQMEQHLPVPKAVKTTRGRESPIRVVDLVYSSGDARKSVQTIAFNLPNDERVRKEKGAKKVLLRNSIQTKFDVIMKPIAELLMDESHHADLSNDAFFNEVLFHELSHSLGPAFTKQGGKKVEVRMALGPHYSPLEECKADVMGAYNILFMIEKGEFPAEFKDKLLVSYFAGLFRSVRFGVAEAHGMGAAVQLNRFLSEGAAKVEETGKFKLDLAKLEESIGKLVTDLVMIQHEGDPEQAEKLLAGYGVMTAPLDGALRKLKDIPVDIRPVYPLAGETEPR